MPHRLFLHETHTRVGMAPPTGAGSRLALSAILSLLLLAATWGPALADDATELINELMCPADCVMTLATCDMPEAARMRGFIKEKVAEGWTKQQITDTLVAQYGERLLAAPTKKGFNLTAWLTPFAAILGGAIVIFFLVAGWVRQRRVHDAYVRASVARSAPGSLDRYRAQLTAELETFE